MKDYHPLTNVLQSLIEGGWSANHRQIDNLIEGWLRAKAERFVDLSKVNLMGFDPYEILKVEKNKQMSISINGHWVTPPEKCKYMRFRSEIDGRTYICYYDCNMEPIGDKEVTHRREVE